jgi:CheY-specific phosphatase CheX
MSEHAYAALFSSGGLQWREQRQVPEFSQLQAELTRITTAVCSGLLGIEPEPDNRVAPDIGDVLVGSIRYKGEWSGSLSVEFGLFEAVALAHRLLGPDADATSLASDLMGELANVIAGNLKPILPRGADTDVPSVTVVSSRTPNLEEPPIAQQAFAFGGGRLLVSFRAKSSAM